jgi:hypothetical protein
MTAASAGSGISDHWPLLRPLSLTPVRICLYKKFWFVKVAAQISSMNARLIKLTSVTLLVGTLSMTGCENLSPGANGAIAGVGAGALAGGIASAAGMSNRDAALIGLGTGALVGIGTYLVAKHQATERQRRIAEANARAYYRNLNVQQKKAFRARKSHYVAVETAHEGSKGNHTVMLVDPVINKVDPTAYDVKKTPPVGQNMKVDTVTAPFVGGSETASRGSGSTNS